MRHLTITAGIRTRAGRRRARGKISARCRSVKAEPAAPASRLPQYGLAGLGLAFLLTLGIAAWFNLGAFAAADGGLVITGVRQSPIDSNGLRVMELSGNVENRSREAKPLPALIAQMKSDNGAINQSAISLGDGLLPAGERRDSSFAFRLPVENVRKSRSRLRRRVSEGPRFC